MTTTPQTDQSESRLGFVIMPNNIAFDVDENVYSLETVYGASYLFVDRCFLFLSRPQPGIVNVRVTPRKPATAEELDTLAGEFANELLSQALRVRLANSTMRIREYYSAAALRAAAATTSPSIDELLAELESEELGDDPLEIMVPWEEKHGQQEQAAEPKKDPE